MVSLNIMSDLHLISPTIISKQTADVTILAGDCGESPSTTMEYAKASVPNAKNIIQVPGNHDFIGETYDDAIKIMKSQQTDTHRLLENDIHYILDKDIPLRFIGGTLWTDFHLDKNFMNEHRNRIEDFYRIKNFSPEEWLKRHQITKEFFFDTLNTSFNGASIIVHHHLTGMKSVHEFFYSHPRTPAYVPSDMEKIYTHPKCSLIVHGHTHNSIVWRENKKSPLVVCNPYGNQYDYNNSSLNEEFDPNLIVTIKDDLKAII